MLLVILGSWRSCKPSVVIRKRGGNSEDLHVDATTDHSRQILHWEHHSIKSFGGRSEELNCSLGTLVMQYLRRSM